MLDELGLLDLAIEEYSRHREAPSQGSWLADDAASEQDPLTHPRRLGPGDDLVGVSEHDNAHFRDSGYRHLARGAEQRRVQPTTTSHGSRSPSAQRPAVWSFDDTLTVRTLTPGKDRRLEFSALAEPLHVEVGQTFVLQPRDLSGVTVLTLVAQSGEDEAEGPSARLKSKCRLALDPEARSLVEATWNTDYATTRFTVVGPGLDFVAVLMPDTGLSAVLNLAGNEASLGREQQ